MTLFYVLAALLVFLALAIIARPLLGHYRLQHMSEDEENISIARENLAELKADLEAGRISASDYEQARLELERGLIEDIESQDPEAQSLNKDPRTGKLTLLGLVVLIPMLAVPAYLWLGTPEALSPEFRATASHPQQAHSMAELVERLAQRMQEEPDNLEGWLMLGRSYMVMEQYDKAVSAYAQAYRLKSEDPDVILFYADALAMSKGGRLAGDPETFIRKALQLQPDNPKGLWLMGMAQAEQGKFEAALDYWNRLLPMLQDEPKSQAELLRMMNFARKKLGQSPLEAPAVGAGDANRPGGQTAQTRSARIIVRVELDPALKGKFNPDDTLFVYARALDGPPMPLAIVRHKAVELPLTVTLDDSQAMMPAMRLSKFKTVRISARISASGQAKPQTGDLLGEVSPVAVKDGERVTITINKIVQ